MKRIWLGVAALVAVAGGCEKAPAVGQVTGVVKVNGKPHAGIELRFHPAGDSTGAGADGLSGIGGEYRLEFYDHAGRDYRPGAIAGRYKVVLIDQSRPTPKAGEKMAPSAVPGPYTDPRTTPLEVEVKPGDNVIDISVP